MPRIKVEIPSTLSFATDISVRIMDINYGGHLGNDAVLSILHEARMRFLREYGFSEQNIEGVGMIMVDSAIQYRAESFYGDILKIEVGVSDLGTLGCDIVYRVTNRESGRETVRAKTGIAFFDYASRKLVAVPEGFRRVFGAE
jgi:YbgC/YbaW family acyl-CoA thioester hydrolase